MAPAESGVPRVVRCAVYTRKSTEEGLSHEFNSLDAQATQSLDFRVYPFVHEVCVSPVLWF